MLKLQKEIFTSKREVNHFTSSAVKSKRIELQSSAWGHLITFLQGFLTVTNVIFSFDNLTTILENTSKIVYIFGTWLTDIWHNLDLVASIVLVYILHLRLASQRQCRLLFAQACGFRFRYLLPRLLPQILLQPSQWQM